MFNMWDYKMSLSEIMALSCNAVGNVVNWDTLQEKGTGSFHDEVFNCEGKGTDVVDQVFIELNVNLKTNYYECIILGIHWNLIGCTRFILVIIIRLSAYAVCRRINKYYVEKKNA